MSLIFVCFFSCFPLRLICSIFPAPTEGSLKALRRLLRRRIASPILSFTLCLFSLQLCSCNFALFFLGSHAFAAPWLVDGVVGSVAAYEPCAAELVSQCTAQLFGLMPFLSDFCWIFRLCFSFYLLPTINFYLFYFTLLCCWPRSFCGLLLVVVMCFYCVVFVFVWPKSRWEKYKLHLWA